MTASFPGNVKSFGADVVNGPSNLIDAAHVNDLRAEVVAVETALFGGWMAQSETWTYVNAYSFTVPGDRTAVYTKGRRVKWTQTTIKFGVINSSSLGGGVTTVVICVNTDYVITNTAISANAVSDITNPQGFPNWFNFSPTWSNLTVGNGTLIAKYSVVGDILKLHVNIKWAAGSPTTSIGGTDVSITPPVTPASGAYSGYSAIGGVAIVDAATALYMGEAVLASGVISARIIKVDGTYAVWAYVSATVPFTWGASDEMDIQAQYQI